MAQVLKPQQPGDGDAEYRPRRKPSDDRPNLIISRLADALIYALSVKDASHWVWRLEKGNEATIEEVVERWVLSKVPGVSDESSRVLFPLLLKEFEQLYFSEGWR